MTSYRCRTYKCVRITTFKYCFTISVRCYYNLLSSFFNTRKQKWCFIRGIIYYSAGSCIHRFPRCRILRIFIYSIRWCLRFMFLFWNWISWFTRYNRYNILSRGFLTFASISPDWKPSSGFGSRYIVLALRRCSVAIFVPIRILLGILIILCGNLMLSLTYNSTKALVSLYTKLRVFFYSKNLGWLFLCPPKPIANGISIESSLSPDNVVVLFGATDIIVSLPHIEVLLPDIDFRGLFDSIFLGIRGIFDGGITPQVNINIDPSLLNGQNYNFNSQLRAISHYLSRVETHTASVNQGHTFLFNPSYWVSINRDWSISDAMVMALLALLSALYALMPFIGMLSQALGAHIMAIIIRVIELLLKCLPPKGALRNLLLFSMFPKGVQGLSMSNNTIKKIITWIGIPLYTFVTNPIYDFRYRNFIRIIGPYFGWSNRFINWPRIQARNKLSVLFAINIFIGVWVSTTLWELYYSHGTISSALSIVASFFLAGVSSGVWLLLGRISMDEIQYSNRVARFFTCDQPRISLLRSVAESTAFNALSWFTFSLWDYWSTLNLHHMISWGIGLIGYSIAGYYQIGLEQDLDNPIAYAFAYTASFTSLAFSTNGLIFFILDLIPRHLWFTVAIAAHAAVLVMPMVYYRTPSDIDLSRYNNRNRLIRFLRIYFDRYPHMLYFYILFLSFAAHTYIEFDWMYFMG